MKRMEIQNLPLKIINDPKIINDVNEHKNIENDCALTRINKSNIKNKKTTRKLKYSREEKSNILTNKMLSDESIGLAQQLLKK